jgi:LacI family transcriptional regulator
VDDHPVQDAANNEVLLSRLPTERPATILDVARLAHVSKSTVSNVIRGVGVIAPATKERVRQAVDTLGYRPNLIARQMVQQRTSLIGVVIGDLANPFYSEMTKAVEWHATARGYRVMICNTQIDERRELASLRSLLDYRVAGLIMLAYAGDAESRQLVTEAGVPSVFVTCMADWGDVVSTDDEKGGRLATEHLIGLGHTRIAYVGDSSVEDAADHARAAGYRKAMAEAGLKPSIHHWRKVSLEALLTGRPCVSGVVSSNDLGAIEILDTADRLGLRVPEDLSVVGYDDIIIAGLRRIALTTIAQPKDELARCALDMLHARVTGSLSGSPKRAIVECGLVVRTTTARARR